MILVFGGTTEGRIAVKTLDEGEGKYFYSTRGDFQHVECIHGIHVTGGMNSREILEFCGRNGVRLIIDAAHPFASGLHSAVEEVSKELQLPVVRFERRYSHPDAEGIVWCRDYDEAMSRMAQDGVKSLLAMTGVQTISRLRSFWTNVPTWFRILDRDDSREKAEEAGFPISRVVYYEEGNTGSLFDRLKPEAIITKESGNSGGFSDKVKSALSRGIKVYVVSRPNLPDDFITVDGPHGLRMAVERLLPEFYPLHTGFTTGSCATAAAKAALAGLLTGERLASVSFRLPEGETVSMDIESVEISENKCLASVIKDAGDDPDVTHRSRIYVEVSLAAHDGIRFVGGKGIGRVTLPGLGLEVGEPAINPVPRKMMESELRSLYSGGLDVVISLEGGEELAQKTFNPRVGVVGGVSIIGTTGVIRPFSHEAFVESIKRELEVAVAMKCGRVVVNSGGKSERFMKTLYPDLPQQAFVHYGNAVGDTMRLAEELKIPQLTIGLMLGKAVKLAEGHFDTHSHKVTLNKRFLQNVAAESGCSSEGVDAIEKITLARELWKIFRKDDADRFFNSILNLCHKHCGEIYHGSLEAVLITEDGCIEYRKGTL